MRSGGGAEIRAVFPEEPIAPCIVASEGQLQDVRLEGSVVRAWYVPPLGGPPRVVVLAVYDADKPDPRPVVRRLRLLGFVEVPVEAPPGSSVVVEIEGVRYGPEVVGSSGMVTVQARAGPAAGPRPARVFIGDRPAVEQELPAEAGSGGLPRAAFIPVPDSLPADGQAEGLIFVHTFNPDGSLLDAALPALWSETQVGLGDNMVRVAPGLFAAAYRVPVGISAREIIFHTQVAGEEPVSGRVRLAGVPPERFDLEVVPDSLRVEPGSSAMVVVYLEAAGSPVPGQPLELEAIPGELTPLRDRGDGSYVATYSPPMQLPNGPVEVRITARLSDVGSKREQSSRQVRLRLEPGPARRLRIKGRVGRVPANGVTSVELNLLLMDSQGNAVQETPELRVDLGRLKGLSPRGHGRFRTDYVPPDLPHLEVRHELQFEAWVDGREIEIAGGLTLAPVLELVSPSPADGFPGVWGWLGKAPSESFPPRLLGILVGWTALFGDGLFGKAGGPCSRLDLLFRPGDGSRLYLGWMIGVASSSMRTRAHASQLSPEMASMEVELSQTMIPMMGELRLRFGPHPRVTFSTGLLLGALIVQSRVMASGMSQDLDNSSVELAGELPLGVELSLGDAAIVLELALTSTITQLSGSQLRGSSIGVVGPVRGLSASGGIRWRLP